MSNILHDMKDSLTRYSEAISQVIDAAVSVVDDQQIRVLYKGRKWSFQSGVSMVEKFVCRPKRTIRISIKS